MANRKTKLPLGHRYSMKAGEMRSFIHSLRGKYKFDTGGKSFNNWMADLNQEEKELEERKLRK